MGVTTEGTLLMRLLYTECETERREVGEGPCLHHLLAECEAQATAGEMIFGLVGGGRELLREVLGNRAV